MLAELRITPVGDRANFPHLLAAVVRLLHESGLAYQVNTMGTVIEGDIGTILQTVRRCHEEARKYTSRALLEVAIDDCDRTLAGLVHGLDHLRTLTHGIALERQVGGASEGIEFERMP